jgi:hypothetical protein
MSHELNKTELIAILRNEGFGNISRANGIPRLTSALEGDEEAQPCPLEERRTKMERHIRRNWTRIRTQLPYCNGKCTQFGCPDAVVVGCWLRFKDEII